MNNTIKTTAIILNLLGVAVLSFPCMAQESSLIERSLTPAIIFNDKLDKLEKILPDMQKQALVWEGTSNKVKSGEAFFSADGKLRAIRIFDVVGHGHIKTCRVIRFYLIDDNRLAAVKVENLIMNNDPKGSLEILKITPRELINFQDEPVECWFWTSVGWVGSDTQSSTQLSLAQYYKKKLAEALQLVR